jgi:hypothetical protein
MPGRISSELSTPPEDGRGPGRRCGGVGGGRLDAPWPTGSTACLSVTPVPRAVAAAPHAGQAQADTSSRVSSASRPGEPLVLPQLGTDGAQRDVHKLSTDPTGGLGRFPVEPGEGPLRAGRALEAVGLRRGRAAGRLDPICGAG